MRSCTSILDNDARRGSIVYGIRRGGGESGGEEE